MGEEMAGDVVAGDVEEQQVVEAGEEVGREEGERVVLGEQLLQVGALLEDGRGHGEWGPLEGPLVRRMPPACCLLFFVVALICFVSAFVFAVIVICF